VAPRNPTLRRSRRALLRAVLAAATLPLWLTAAAASNLPTASPAMHIASTAFTEGQPIPTVHTCEGKDTSPPLSWGGVPAGAKSLALLVDDPDAPDPAAPRMTWVHWVLYNAAPSATGLPEAVAPKALPAGTLEGVNDWHRTGYGGPCPPIGRHRYFFKLYALDTVLPDLKHPTKAALERAMQGHVIGEAVLIGTYQKRR